MAVREKHALSCRQRPMKQLLLSAGVIIVNLEQGEPRYLLLRAYRHWDFPKGLVETEEEPLQAAIREVEEETTICQLDFSWGTDYRETPPYGRGKIARYYLARTAQTAVELPISPELGHPEHDEYRWLTYRTAHRLLNERLQPMLDWAREKVRD